MVMEKNINFEAPILEVIQLTEAGTVISTSYYDSVTMNDDLGNDSLDW